MSFKFGKFAPLLFVWMMSMLKEAYEDWHRRVRDRETNHRKVLLLSRSGLQLIRWEQAFVGCILRINERESIPADMIILDSSNGDGACFAKTVELDGETNLKVKKSNAAVLKHTRGSEWMKGDPIECSVAAPDSDLFTFSATLRFLPESDPIFIGPENVMLRGCSLHNTQWILGLVCYAGSDCRLMCNLSPVPLKMSFSQRIVNRETFRACILLLILAGCSFFANCWSYRAQERSRVDLVLVFLRFICLYSPIIPVSVGITTEFVKMVQSHYVHSDAQMSDSATGCKAVVTCSDLMDSLGQVEVILTDKTGTLTKNEMHFRKCCVGSAIFDDSKANSLSALEGQHSEQEEVRHFIRNVMSCNSVFIQPIQELASVPAKNFLYTGISPEECCMLQKLLEHNFTLQQRTDERSVFSTGSGTDVLDVIYRIEFSSARKRMTVLVRDADGAFWVYCKGADDFVLPRCRNLEEDESRELVASIRSFSREGLRTLCFAYRSVSPAEAEQILESLRLFSIRQHPTCGSDSELSDFLAAKLEVNLALNSVSGVEDSLQDCVSETIEKLSIAGIRIWMLTGDKQETAVDIARLSKLIDDDTELFVLNQAITNEALVKIVSRSSQAAQSPNELSNTCILLDGALFDFLRKDLAISKLLLTMAMRCKALVMFRASPDHKGQLARSLRLHFSNRCVLAIGDGANDVSMIREANVGIGIFGKEGLQASKSADFAICQFKHLQRLLLVHGAWSYHRLSKSILFLFYKNLVHNLAHFFYSFDSNHSGVSFFESLDLAFYNLAYTQIPPAIIGTLEQFLPAAVLLRFPQLYLLGPRQRFFSQVSILAGIFNGVFHSLFIYYVLRYFFLEDLFLCKKSAMIGGKIFFSTVVVATQIVTITFKSILSATAWSSINFLVNIANFVSVAAFFAISKHAIIGYAIRSGVFWSCVVGVSFGALTKDAIWKYLKRRYFPTCYHIALNQELSDQIRKRKLSKAIAKREQSSVSSINEASNQELFYSFVDQVGDVLVLASP